MLKINSERLQNEVFPPNIMDKPCATDSASHFMFRQKGDKFLKQFLAISSPLNVFLDWRKHFVDLRAHSFANVLAFQLPGMIVEHANEGFGCLSSQMLFLAELHELHARCSLWWLFHGVG